MQDTLGYILFINQFIFTIITIVLNNLNYKADETVEQRENRLAQDKENKRVKRATKTAEQHELRLQKKCERYHMKRKERLVSSNIEEQLNRQDEPLQDDSEESRLPETDRKLLYKFRTKINSFINKFCPCFSADNNMDPGDVPEELCDLTEIEEMLIARIFPLSFTSRNKAN
ncbi:hypothetical protein RhiirC2_796450 [Rhizophagus irregularis]|uniref:DUF6570 domain-containing protein n=1 Tax=Rhizophagus irregularis TaxID=588596 RepID=A0A2N1M9P0_9GLOM|nr:hypothetical protein RhiirC2_796450 [Rhizophagus irregularis]